MKTTIIIGIIIIIYIFYICILKFIHNNIKKVSFQEGMFPKETGKYYIILNNEIITTDFYNADKCQWNITKNPGHISHFAEYGE